MSAAQIAIRSLFATTGLVLLAACGTEHDEGKESAAATPAKREAPVASGAATPETAPGLAGGSPARNDGHDDLRALADQIERRAPALEQVKGETQIDGKGMQYMAYLDDGSIALVETMVDVESASPSFDTFYFNNNRLFRYQSFQARPGASEGSQQQVLVEMLFDENGALANAVTEVDGRAEETPDVAVRAVLRRAEELLEAAYMR